MVDVIEMYGPPPAKATGRGKFNSAASRMTNSAN